MALTEPVRRRLEGQGFNTLYEQNQPIWQGLAEDARKLYAAQLPDGRQPTVDDIKKLLVPLIELKPLLREFLNRPRKPLIQKFWITDFADYILHRVYDPNLNIPQPPANPGGHN